MKIFPVKLNSHYYVLENEVKNQMYNIYSYNTCLFETKEKALKHLRNWKRGKIPECTIKKAVKIQDPK